MCVTTLRVGDKYFLSRLHTESLIFDSSLCILGNDLFFPLSGQQTIFFRPTGMKMGIPLLIGRKGYRPSQINTHGRYVSIRFIFYIKYLLVTGIMGRLLSCCYII